MTKKHLDFYNECMKSGSLPVKCITANWNYGGLCGCAEVGLIDFETFELFNQYSSSYWAYYEDWTIKDKSHLENHLIFNPLRQTIVLLMAAINNEL